VSEEGEFEKPRKQWNESRRSKSKDTKKKQKPIGIR
jgi:hypothetical protein